MVALPHFFSNNPLITPSPLSLEIADGSAVCGRTPLQLTVYHHLKPIPLIPSNQLPHITHTPWVASPQLPKYKSSSLSGPTTPRYAAPSFRSPKPTSSDASPRLQTPSGLFSTRRAATLPTPSRSSPVCATTRRTAMSRGSSTCTGGSGLSRASLTVRYFGDGQGLFKKYIINRV